MNSTKLTDESKNEINKILMTSQLFLNHLSQSSHNTDEIDNKTQLIYQFIENNEEISGGVKQKIFRFIRDVMYHRILLLFIPTELN